jgi:hypothetical protein
MMEGQKPTHSNNLQTMEKHNFLDKSKEQRAKSRKQEALCSMVYALSPMLLVLSSLFLFLHGCSKVAPPDDYYQQVLEMEEHGEQARRDTGRQPGEVVVPVSDSEPVRIATSPVHQLTADVSREEGESEQEGRGEGRQEEPEEPPRREVVRESPSSPTLLHPEPIAAASDVIKSALKAPDLGISVRTVELVNGRLSGGRNSVRVNFSSESMNVIEDKFVAICAVIYHLDRGTNTVDVVVGIAEDEQANLLAILQSDMSDITAWMTNEFSRAEWFSRVTKRIL